MTSTAAPSIVLSTEEIRELTGYRQRAAQLTELWRLGFERARKSKSTGRIILERAHYDAVCAGAQPDRQPQVRPPTERDSHGTKSRSAAPRLH